MERAVEEKIRSYLKDDLQESGTFFTKILVGSGTLNETYRLELNGKRFFCKVNSANKFPQLFEKEVRNLDFLALHSSFKIPKVNLCCEVGEKQLLLMEWIDPVEQTAAFWKNFGRFLAELHRVSEDYFGWTEDNYMGLVLQDNRKQKSWASFFREQRLEPLFRLCLTKGFLQPHHEALFHKVYKRLDEIFDPGSRPVLLHGDLWSGNFISGTDNRPVLIDPATYFGHEAIDLGMTTLFGGFSRSFYESYQYYNPLPSGYRQQWKLANLYPLLIHLLLFGEQYLPAIKQTLSEFE